MVQIQPFGDRILVKVIEESEVMAGGLLVAPTPIEKSNKGIVAAIGDGENAAKVSVGDKVIFQVGGGLTYRTDKSMYKILDIREILGRIVEGE